MHDTDDLQTASSILRLGKVRHQLSWVRLASSQAHRTSPTFGVLGDQETPMRKKKTISKGVALLTMVALVRGIFCTLDGLSQKFDSAFTKTCWIDDFSCHTTHHSLPMQRTWMGLYDHFAAIPTQLFWSWSDTESISLFMFNVNTHNNMLEQ